MRCAQAGLPGLITIATNMAGRGTDIILGGNPKGLAQLALESAVLQVMLTGSALFPFASPPACMRTSLTAAALQAICRSLLSMKHPAHTWELSLAPKKATLAFLRAAAGVCWVAADFDLGLPPAEREYAEEYSALPGAADEFCATSSVCDVLAGEDSAELAGVLARAQVRCMRALHACMCHSCSYWESVVATPQGACV